MDELRFPKKLFNTKFLNFVFNVDKPIQILFGGAGSSKTVHSALKNIMRVLQGKNVLVVRQVYGTIQDSYYTELKKAIDILKVGSLFTTKVSPLRIECSNGRVILFRGLSDVEKIKGISVPVGQIDHITIEEVTECKEDSVNQLQFRSRGGGERYEDEDLDVMMEEIRKAKSVDEMNADYFKNNILSLLGVDTEGELSQNGKTLELLLNPVNVSHWVHKRFFCDDKGKSIFDFEKGEYESESLYIMHSTHKDNNFLTLDDHIRYEQYKYINQYFYNVYCLGRWGVLGDLIFTNVKLARFSDEFIHSIPHIYIGMDFGHKPDPNTIVRVGANHQKRELYILDERVKGNISSAQWADIVYSFLWHDKEEVLADSAGSQQIHDLRTAGLNVTPVYKYGKVEGEFKSHGIGVWWGYTIYVSEQNAPTFAREISEYQWAKDKTGVSLGKPQDGNDHCIDAGLFYAPNKFLRGQKKVRIH